MVAACFLVVESIDALVDHLTLLYKGGCVKRRVFYYYTQPPYYFLKIQKFLSRVVIQFHKLLKIV